MKQQKIIKQSGALTAQLDDARKSEATMQAQVSTVAERLAKLKTAYEHAVQNGEADSDLDGRDEEIIRTDRQLVRCEIKLGQCKAEIENLQMQQAAALAHEREEDFLKLFDQFTDTFVMFEIEFEQFRKRNQEIESYIREFINEAAKSGRDIHRLRLLENMRRQVSERLYPTITSKWSDRREQFSRPLADILEEHVRTALGIPTRTEAQPTARLDAHEPRTERSIEQ